MPIVCESASLRETLAHAFRGIPVSFRPRLLKSDLITELVELSFPDLGEESKNEIVTILKAHADTNADGIVDQNELTAFLKDLLSEFPRYSEASHAQSDLALAEDPQAVFYETIMRNLGSDEVDMLRDAFIHMDMDSDGFVSLEEMLQVVRTVVGNEKFEALAEYLQPIFIVADKDRDGKLSLTEFLLSFAEGPGVVPTEVVNACVSSIRVRLTDEEIFALQERFRKIDTNGDGFIDQQELLVGLKEALGTKFPEPNEATYAQILNVVMALADTDHDGRLSLSEFIRSFQEDQGVLPAVFIDTRGISSARGFTAEEETIIRDVLDSLEADAISDTELNKVLTEKLSSYISDESKVREICELVSVAAGGGDEGRIDVAKLKKDFLPSTIPFVAVEERIEKVKNRLTELLSEEELLEVSKYFAAVPRQGNIHVHTLSSSLFEVLKQLLVDRSDDFVSHVVQLVISTGVLDETNTSMCSIDTFLSTCRSDEESSSVTKLPEEDVMPASDKANTERVTRDASVTNQAKALAVASTPSRPQTSTGYEGSPVKDDISGCPITDSQLKREFEKYDVNKNGFLDREAFKAIYLGLEHFGVEPTQNEINELFTRYARGSQTISYAEFTVLMLHRSKM